MANRRTARKPARRRSSAGARPKPRTGTRKAAPAGAKGRATGRRSPRSSAVKSTSALATRKGSPRSRPTARQAPPPARVPSAIGLVMQHMSYTSHDLGAVRRFYTETLGFTESNLDPRYDYLYVRTGTTSSFGFMAPLPGPPEQWRPPREPAIHLIVEDVDRAYQALIAKGVVFEQDPTDMPWGHRTAVLRDPEGRLVSLAQPIARKERP